MARKGKAKAGSSRTGRLVLDPSRRNGNGEAVHAGGAEGKAAANMAAPQVKILGEGQTAETETRLYTYCSQMTSSQPAVFPPLEELHARLPELERRPNGVVPADSGDDALGFCPPATGDDSRSSPGWLEQRFGELKQFLSTGEGDKSGIAAVHVKLAEIGARIDMLPARMAGDSTIEAIETKLDALSRSFDETRSLSSADADRTGQTMAEAAAFQSALEPSSDSLIEAELCALKRQVQENAERTEAALERLHTTLRELLDLNIANRGLASMTDPKKPPRLHMPISSPNSAPYMRAQTGFGAVPADKPRLDVLTIREMHTPGLNSIKALEEISGRAEADEISDSQETGAKPENPPPGPSKLAAGRDEDKSVPVMGIGIVAFILLMAAAALYYLQTARHFQPSDASIQHGTLAGASSAALPAAPGDAASLLRAAQAAYFPGEARVLPALLTSASDNRAGVAPRAERIADDLKDLEAAARLGDSEAQFRIGTRFLTDGAFSNGGAATAARWLAKAAGQGHLEAQFMLASLYERGAGVTKDENEAMSLYRKAANAGHIRAMHNLGVLLSAHESPQDYSEAAVWFARAAQAGLTDSQYNLALLYERGLGVEQDLSRAYLWYRAAGRGGDKEAVRQAERLKRALPAGEAGTQASSWRPALEDRSRSGSRG